MTVPPIAARQGGLFSFAQALTSGVTRRELRRALVAGVIVELCPSVYADAVRPVSTGAAKHVESIVSAQLALGPGWLAARRSSALLMGLPLIGLAPPPVPQLVRDPGAKATRSRSRHACVASVPREERVRYLGVPTTAPARTVADIARQEVFRNGVVVTDGALRRGMSREELRLVLDRQQSWPGVVRAREVARFADGRAESAGESVTRVACLLEGLAVPEPQVEVWRDDELVARVDLMYKEELLVIESDGALKFVDAGVLPALLERHERIRDCGIEVLRTDWSQTFRHTGLFGVRVRDRLASAGARRLAPGVRLVSTDVRPVRPSLAMPKRRSAA